MDGASVKEKNYILWVGIDKKKSLCYDKKQSKGVLRR